VERLSHASDNAELAWTVVRLGQSLQLVTVAEGSRTRPSSWPCAG